MPPRQRHGSTARLLIAGGELLPRACSRWLVAEGLCSLGCSRGLRSRVVWAARCRKGAGGVRAPLVHAQVLTLTLTLTRVHAQVLFGHSDTLVARSLGHNSRGEHWLRWAEASAADVVVLGATAHVCAPRRCPARADTRTAPPPNPPPPPPLTSSSPPALLLLGVEETEAHDLRLAPPG